MFIYLFIEDVFRTRKEALMKTTTMTSTCPFTTAIIITTTAVIIIITVVIHPSYSIPLLSHSTDDDHAMEDMNVHLQSAVMTTTVMTTMTGDHGRVEERDHSTTTDRGGHDNDALNKSSTMFSVTEDFMRLLINSYLEQTPADDDDDDDAEVDGDYMTCYRTTNFVLAEKQFVINNGDDDDYHHHDDDDVTPVKESTDVLTFKVVVKKYKSIRRHPLHRPPPPPHPHLHHQQRSGSHGDRQPIKFCLRRESNVNRGKNSSDLYGRINYDNEEAGNETNGSGESDEYCN